MLRESGKLRGWISAATCLVAISIIATQAQAKSQFIQASDAAPGQQFGDGISGDGNLLAILEPRSQTSTGAVCVFANINGNWVQEAKITPPASSAGFGFGMALRGNTIVVGSADSTPNGEVSDAQVYTLENGVWVETAVLIPAEPHVAFGSIAISGNTVALGAGSDSTALGPTGAVYIFVNNGGVWTEQAQLVPSDPAARGLGTAVGIDGDLVVAGAPNTTVRNLFGAGEAFVFGRSNGTWSQQAILVPTDSDVADQFGSTASISGTSAAIGALKAGDDEAGRAYVFVGNGGVWSLQQELTGQGVTFDGDFGFNIGILGDTMLVGAYEDGSDDGAGTAHIFKRNNGVWTETANLKPGSNGVAGPLQSDERFANFLTIIGPETSPTFVMGAPTFGDNRSIVGAAYILH